MIVLGTVNLEFQGQFIPISLRPILRMVEVYVTAVVWSPCNYLLQLGRSGTKGPCLMTKLLFCPV